MKPKVESKDSANLFRVQLLVQKSNKRVLYMEAGKDFVEVLFSFLMLSTGAFIKLMSQGLDEWPAGVFSNIFKCFEKLSSSVLNNGCKDNLLSPRPPSDYCASSLLGIQGVESCAIRYYTCSSFCCRGTPIMTINAGEYCARCKSFSMTKEIVESRESLLSRLVEAPATTAGYVKVNTTFMITDDMEIYPTSTIKSIVLLNKLKVENMSDLDNIEIAVGSTQALQLLRASLTTRSALNEVFSKSEFLNRESGAPPVVVPKSWESARHRADLVRVQLLVQKSTKRVLYMEAGKDFVDMLFSFLMLPTGAVIKLISQGLDEWPVGAISNIFKSVDNLNASFMNIGCKNILLSPQPAWGYSASSLLRIQGAESDPTTYYICSNFCSSTSPGNRIVMTRNLGDLCPRCKYPMTRALTAPQESLSTELESKPAGAGYVKENTTYMITDDMEIYPTSTIKSIVLLNKLKVENMSDLDSLEIAVGVTQALQLLRASLTTSSALNEVFAKE
ncbi:unnamed protein product [Sphagnum compactum]